ncbi:MAG: SMP-30/gluconolactonase/LRE family protein [Terriglobia bacterium]|jgi:DNA-binding beta-propeller fold protein YncE
MSNRPDSLRRVKFGIAALSLLALALVLPAPLRAGKKKEQTPPPVNLADQRVHAYFDITKIVWPNPPAIARIAFQDLFTGEKIDPSLYTKKGHKQTWMDRLAGTQSTDQIQIDKLPFQLMRTYGVGVDSKGLIYAGDQGVGAVFIFDAEKKDHVELIGHGRQANFGRIVGLALDDDDRLFVADAQLHHVLEFNVQHRQEAAFGGEVLVRPGGVAIDRENRFLYVADTGNDVVDVFDADSFKLLRQIGKPSRKHEQTDPGTFSLPEGVAVDKDGNVYVTDTFNDRVEIFDADGEFISTFGKNGDGPADLERPKGIAVDCDGHIWVVDAAQNRVKVFNQQGRLLIYFGGQGYYPGQFMGPWGIAIDPSNRVIVSETLPGRVQVFRYVTDAQAAAEKARREAAEQKAAVAPASSRQDSSAAKPAGVAPEQKQPAPEAPEAKPDLAAKKDSAAQ